MDDDDLTRIPIIVSGENTNGNIKERDREKHAL